MFVGFLLALLAPFIVARAPTKEVTEAYEKAEPLIFHLTSATFQSSVANGHWLVFYGAKWCGHCQAFTPIWLDFEIEMRENQWKGVNVGKVECTLNQDLCESLDGFPTVLWFVDGVQKGEVVDRTMNGLKSKATKIIKSINSDGKAFRDLKELVALESKPNPSSNPKGEVADLTGELFDKLTTGKPWLVMFYAPWCHHCKSLKPTYAELAAKLQNKFNIGNVDCTRDNKPCRKFEIQGYPTILYLNQPDEKEEYHGPRTLESLEEFALGFTGKPSFTPIRASEVKQLVDESESLVLFVYDGDKETNILDLIKMVSKSVRNKIKVYVCPEIDATSSLPYGYETDGPVLSIFTDKGVRHHSYKGDFTNVAENRSQMKEWILKNRYPLVVELSVENQPDINNIPYVVMLLVDPDSNTKGKAPISELRLTAKAFYESNSNSENVKFTWLDAVKFSDYVKTLYGIKQEDLPRYIIANAQDDLYFDSHPDKEVYTLDQELVIKSLNDVLEDKNSPKSTKGVVGQVYNVIRKYSRAYFQFVTGSIFGLLTMIVPTVAAIYYLCFYNPEYTKLSTQIGADSDRKLD
ncbi:thioredoxin-like protein [Globomyces pollinis-pini]|nr:thioredoxin-like protein [Globomyces pollinis-pini]